MGNLMILLMIYFTVSVGCMASNKPEANKTKNLLFIHDFLDYALIVNSCRTCNIHSLIRLTLQSP